MTKTALELWNDKGFIQKRIKEQKEYIRKRFPNVEAFLYADKEEREYVRVAEFQLQKFEKRLRELNSNNNI